MLMRETKKIGWSHLLRPERKFELNKREFHFGVYLQQYNIQKNDLPESGV